MRGITGKVNKRRFLYTDLVKVSTSNFHFKVDFQSRGVGRATIMDKIVDTPDAMQYITTTPSPCLQLNKKWGIELLISRGSHFYHNPFLT